jgi:hypothetical protein
MVIVTHLGIAAGSGAAATRSSPAYPLLPLTPRRQGQRQRQRLVCVWERG